MKKLTAIILMLAFLFCGCAGWKQQIQDKVCDHPEYKSYVKALLTIAQVGYMTAVAIAKAQANAKVTDAMNNVDMGLNTLGMLTYDVLCPTLADLEAAEKALDKVQAAKVEMGALK